MTVIDLEDPKMMAMAIANGWIWSAPQAAIMAACEGIASGAYPPPNYIPDEWQYVINDKAGKTILPSTGPSPQDIP